MIRKSNFFFSSFKFEDILRGKESIARDTERPDGNYTFEMSELRYFLMLLRKRVTKQKEALIQERNMLILYI
jgi:hypothetical protein